MMIIIQIEELDQTNNIFKKYWSKSNKTISIIENDTNLFLKKALDWCAWSNSEKFIIIEKNIIIYNNENYIHEIKEKLNHFDFVHGFWDIYFFNKSIQNYCKWMLKRNKLIEFGNYDGEREGFYHLNSYLGKTTHMLNTGSIGSKYTYKDEKVSNGIYGMTKNLIQKLIVEKLTINELKSMTIEKQTHMPDVAFQF